MQGKESANTGTLEVDDRTIKEKRKAGEQGEKPSTNKSAGNTGERLTPAGEGEVGDKKTVRGLV